MVRHQLDRLLAGMDLVTREEFDAVKEMAAEARTENEKLEARLAVLEAKRSKPAARKAGASAKKGHQRKRIDPTVELSTAFLWFSSCHPQLCLRVETPSGTLNIVSRHLSDPAFCGIWP